jgi:hypothetical protein
VLQGLVSHRLDGPLVGNVDHGRTNFRQLPLNRFAMLGQLAGLCPVSFDPHTSQ